MLLTFPPGVVYVLLCILLLFSNMPQTSIEPVDLRGQGSLSHIGGRGPKEAGSPDHVGAGLSRMMSLVHSAMFVDQGIKLKWIRERISR